MSSTEDKTKPESTKKSKNAETIQFKRNSTCLVQSPLSNFNFLNLENDIYDVPIFTPPLPICANEPNKFQSRPDLFIEVINDNVLKGVVRYTKDYAIANIPTIAAKYRDGNNFRIENKRGIDVYRIEHDCEPEIVSEFFAGVSVGKLQLTSDNALDFHHLSDFLQCSEITRLIKNYIYGNMNNTMLLRAWAFGDDFKKSCENFIEGRYHPRKIEVFDFEMFSEEVACLSLGQLQHFINTVGEGLNGMLVSLLLKWLDHGSNKQFCAALTMSISFVDVGIEDRVKYHSAILGNLEPELIEACSNMILHKSKAKLDPELMSFLQFVEPTLIQIESFQGFRSNKIGPDGQLYKALEKYIETTDADTTHRKFVDQSWGRPESHYKCGFIKFTSRPKKTFNGGSMYKLSKFYDDYDFESIFSAPIATSVPVFSWRMQVKYAQKQSCVSFAIIDEHDTRQTGCLDDFNHGYAWYSSDTESKKVQKSYKQGINYGSKIKSGDIVEVKFHQQERKLEFFLNDESQGIAFEGITSQYGIGEKYHGSCPTPCLGHGTPGDEIRYKLLVTMSNTQVQVRLLTKWNPDDSAFEDSDD